MLVFCCDETFDFQAMGRIFVGLCQVGAWGCFDEFNRLEERILSAVSQQVQSIQQGLASLVKNPNTEIELVGKSVKINKNMGTLTSHLFILNRYSYSSLQVSSLQLIPATLVVRRSHPISRSSSDRECWFLNPLAIPNPYIRMAMTRPDRELIAQVMLFSQGFRTAESLASKIVPFFNLCDEQLSPQPHYDFGLRALKAVLASAGILKRERMLAARSGEDNLEGLSDTASEQMILIQSVTETIVPKLVADDVPLLTRYVTVGLHRIRILIKFLLACLQMCSPVKTTYPSISTPSAKKSGKFARRRGWCKAIVGSRRFSSSTRFRRFSTV